MYISPEEFLQHYGVKGMKWGVRRYRNKDGTLTEAGKKREEKEVDKQVAKRNTALYIKSYNYAADRINGKWLDDFNKKWEPKFKGYNNWADSPNYKKYEKAYAKNFSTLMNQAIRSNPDSKFTTKLGSTYTARFLGESGNIVWATQKEWDKHDKKG